jgi:hypothetical protein
MSRPTFAQAPVICSLGFSSVLDNRKIQTLTNLHKETYTGVSYGDVRRYSIGPPRPKHRLGKSSCWRDRASVRVESSWNVMAHGDAGEGKWRGYWRMEWVASTLTLPRNMVYPALLPLMRTSRLPVVDWTDAPTDLNGLVGFAEKPNLVSARVPSHFKRSLRDYVHLHSKSYLEHLPALVALNNPLAVETNTSATITNGVLSSGTSCVVWWLEDTIKQFVVYWFNPSCCCVPA